MAQQMKKADFEAAIAGNQPVLIDFWATWCGPCRIMAPVIEEIAKEYEGRVVVGKIDVDEESEVAQEYGIMSIPTLILFKNGKKTDLKVGVQPKAAVEAMINAAL